MFLHAAILKLSNMYYAVTQHVLYSNSSAVYITALELLYSNSDVTMLSLAG